jgi:MGT family glycosyltransferase
MSRVLIVSLPLAGHLNPTIGIARELVARGHQAAWVGSELFLRPLLGPDATVLPTGSRLYRPQGGQGALAVKSLWQSFVVPYARFTLAAVQAAVQTYQPDVLLVDQHAPAGGLVAHRERLPWATLICSAMELTRPFRALPKVEAWIEEQVQALWAAAGVPPEERYDLRFSPYAVLAPTTAALTGPEPFPDHYALVGPILADRPVREFPWGRLDPARRKVLVSLGTLAPADVTAFYPKAVEALAPLADRVQGVVVAPAGVLPDPPEHVVVTGWAPVLELLPQLAAVVCHGGMNIVCEALAHGVPLVVGPMINDQPVQADQVVAAGAGVRIRLRRIQPDALRSVLTTVLDDPRYRAAARRVQADFAAAGGARAAVDHLERLAGPVYGTKPPAARHRQGTLAGRRAAASLPPAPAGRPERPDRQTELG